MIFENILRRNLGKGDRFVITYYNNMYQTVYNPDGHKIQRLLGGYTHPNMFDEGVTRYMLYPHETMEFNIYHVKNGDLPGELNTTRASMKSLCNVSDDTPCNVIINFHYIIDDIVDGKVYFTQNMIEIFCDLTG
jgi:hypothetical protein